MIASSVISLSTRNLSSLSACRSARLLPISALSRSREASESLRLCNMALSASTRSASRLKSASCSEAKSESRSGSSVLTRPRGRLASVFSRSFCLEGSFSGVISFTFDRRRRRLTIAIICRVIQHIKGRKSQPARRKSATGQDFVKDARHIELLEGALWTTNNAPCERRRMLRPTRL